LNGKRFAVAALTAVNAILVLLLVAQAAPMPTAVAQPGRAGGGYVCATARVAGRTYEVLHMIDLTTRRLHTFYPDGGKMVFTAAPRDLDKDFGK
jgi:hypothetical protein